jgi:tetratricopeptide (TPR) repeat protein
MSLNRSTKANLYRDLTVCALLAASVLAIYGQVRTHQFLAFDDPDYVTQNQHIRDGLSMAGVRWALTATHAHNWHPLTWMSHMLDTQLYGLEPAGHHLTNVLIHILNACLLFLVFKTMTGAVWRSAFVAALFAAHPLHVESVAWVAERKDVLSTFFGMLCMGAYVLYVQRKSRRMYWFSVVLLALGLMSKPMLVTLPCVLLLLDYWPLGRRGIIPLLREKIPYFLLVAASCLITVIAQEQLIKSDTLYPLQGRIANALMAYVGYIGSMVWPRGLAIFYPHQGAALGAWTVTAAALLIVGVTVASLALTRRRYLAAGWFWYLGTLVPVVGLVQVGMQARADRYTYIPLIGLFAIVAWGVNDLLSGRRYRQALQWVLGVAVLVVLAVVTWFQVAHWQTDLTLFKHATVVTTDNAWAHNNLAKTYMNDNHPVKALEHYRQVSRIEPSNPHALMAIGTILAQRGDYDRAITCFSQVLSLRPGYRDADYFLGLAYVRKSEPEPDKAMPHFLEAVQLDPDNPQIHYLLAQELAKLERYEQAREHLRKAKSLSKAPEADGRTDDR